MATWSRCRSVSRVCVYDVPSGCSIPSATGGTCVCLLLGFSGLREGVCDVHWCESESLAIHEINLICSRAHLISLLLIVPSNQSRYSGNGCLMGDIEVVPMCAVR